MSDEEKEFLVGSRRPIRYGTTTSHSTTGIGGKPPRILRLERHKVENSDTLQGIALKYDSSMVEIKRLNKLWSSDSIHLREYLDIPIFDTFQSPSADGPMANGTLKPTDFGVRLNWSPARSPSSQQNLPAEESSSKSSIGDSGAETSIDQILSRIDSNIKSTAKSVRRLAKNSSPSVPDRLLHSSSTVASPEDVNLELKDHSASPSVVVQIAQTGSAGTNGKKLRPATKERLQRLQEQFFEL